MAERTAELATAWAAGRRINCTIEDMAFGGEGVARLEDFVVFVPFVLVGEVVEVELEEVKKRFARGRLLRVIKASPHRVAAPCRYFGACGGCQYQHVAYEEQLRLKRKQIGDLLERVGGFSGVEIDAVVPCPKPYGYRNRIMIRSQWDKPKQGLNIGFLRYDNRLVEDIEECIISEPLINEQLKNVRLNPPPKGGLKVVLRVMPDGWDVPPDSFFQNNFYLLPELVGAVRDRIKASGVRHLIDVYCGVGFFSLELADLVESFAGVELDKAAIQAARRNASQRNCTNGEYIKGSAEEWLPELVKRFPPEETAVILDPPRRGCAVESLELLRKTRPRQIIYVSCHPATLARDLKILCGEGLYEPRRMVPLDMFPQTQHVECVADVRFKEAPAHS